MDTITNSNVNMHHIFNRVLIEKDLSMVSELIHLDNTIIEKDICAVLTAISSIIVQSSFLVSSSEQNIVEIVLSRVISVIRSSRTVEEHIYSFVRLLNICLRFDLNGLNGQSLSVHGKIVSEVLSCIFLDETHRNVLAIALPVVMKFLSRGSPALCHFISDYLSLVAIESADLMSGFASEICQSIIEGGNYQLLPVLSSIYKISPESISPHISSLFTVLTLCSGQDRLALLELFISVAIKQPRLLMSGVPVFCEMLSSSSICLDHSSSTSNANLCTQDIMQILSHMATASPPPLAPHINRLLFTVGKLSSGVESMIDTLFTYSFHTEITLARKILLFVLNFFANQHHQQKQHVDMTFARLQAYIERLHTAHPTLLGAGAETAISATPCVSPPASQPSLSAYSEHLLRLVAQNSHPDCEAADSEWAGKLHSCSFTGSCGSHDMQSSRDLSAAKEHLRALASPRAHTACKPGATKTCSSSSSSILSAVHKSTNRKNNENAINDIFSSSNVILSNNDNGASVSHLTTELPTSTSFDETINVKMSEPRTKDSIVGSGFIERQSAQSHFLNSSDPTSETTCNFVSCNSPGTVPLSDIMTTDVCSTTFKKRNFLVQEDKENILPTINADSEQLNRTIPINLFEPYPMRDAMQQFCEKHLIKIKDYISRIGSRLPLPVKCTIEERKTRTYARFHFLCQIKCDNCLYSSVYYPIKTKNPKAWIHLMFLASQSHAQTAFSSKDSSVISLRNCWDVLRCESISFLEVITGCFPNSKETGILRQELRSARFDDVFEYNIALAKWGCFLCNHPEKAEEMNKADQSLIEGHLKEKKSKWRFFRRWRTRYFTLSGSQLCSDSRNLSTNASPILTNDSTLATLGGSGGALTNQARVLTGVIVRESVVADICPHCLAHSSADPHPCVGPSLTPDLDTGILRVVDTETGHLRSDIRSLRIDDIRSIRVVKSSRSAPKAFEIFTPSCTFMLKAKNGKNAEEWVKCLSAAVAHQHNIRTKSLTGSRAFFNNSNLSHLSTL